MPRQTANSRKIVPAAQEKPASGSTRRSRRSTTTPVAPADPDITLTPVAVPELDTVAITGEPRTVDPAVLAVLTRFNPPWCWHVLYCVHTLGAAGYAELRAALPGPSDSVFTARLKVLAADGYLTRTVHPDPPVRTSYELGPASATLSGLLEQLHRTRLVTPADGSAAT